MTKLALTIIGALVGLIGLIWMGQGSGLFPYPERSFMINDHSWIWWGGGLFILGVAILVYARRRRR
jgi:ABC-type antimicrobial peptide transport system permease subunit